jgi:hypothetical protein
MIARYIFAHNRYTMRDAKITKPYMKSGGLFRGGQMPTLCVAVSRDDQFGIVVGDSWVFALEDGQLREVRIGSQVVLGPCSVR